MSWGKIDPHQVAGSVVCYVDSTIGLPILTADALAKHPPRRPKHLFDRRDILLKNIEKEFKEKFGKIKLQ